MRRSVVYRGRVQGVGFRATTRQVAGAFAVSGWVRNETDGTVRLEVQGTPSDVEGFLARVRETLGHYIQSEHATTVQDAPGEAGFRVSG